MHCSLHYCGSSEYSKVFRYVENATLALLQENDRKRLYVAGLSSVRQTREARPVPGVRFRVVLRVIFLTGRRQAGCRLIDQIKTTKPVEAVSQVVQGERAPEPPVCGPAKARS